jgi:hypothetical protein
VFACIEKFSWLDPGRDHGDWVTFIIIVENSITSLNGDYRALVTKFTISSQRRRA